MIKIGVSTLPYYRAKQLGYGVSLLGYIPGDQELEQRLHRRFRRSRLHGEWFKISPALRRFTENLKPAPRVRRHLLQIRMTPQMKRVLKEAASAKRLQLCTWARSILYRAAKGGL